MFLSLEKLKNYSSLPPRTYERQYKVRVVSRSLLRLLLQYLRSNQICVLLCRKRNSMLAHGIGLFQGYFWQKPKTIDIIHRVITLLHRLFSAFDKKWSWNTPIWRVVPCDKCSPLHLLWQWSCFPHVYFWIVFAFLKGKDHGRYALQWNFSNEKFNRHGYNPS